MRNQTQNQASGLSTEHRINDSSCVIKALPYRNGDLANTGDDSGCDQRHHHGVLNRRRTIFVPQKSPQAFRKEFRHFRTLFGDHSHNFWSPSVFIYGRIERYRAGREGIFSLPSHEDGFSAVQSDRTLRTNFHFADRPKHHAKLPKKNASVFAGNRFSAHAGRAGGTVAFFFPK